MNLMDLNSVAEEIVEVENLVLEQIDLNQTEVLLVVLLVVVAAREENSEEAVVMELALMAQLIEAQQELLMAVVEVAAAVVQLLEEHQQVAQQLHREAVEPKKVDYHHWLVRFLQAAVLEMELHHRED